jgi:N6-L-threonylcarbamoyladenine synthase
MWTVLGIETSCDETAASVVRRLDDGSTQVVSSVIYTQIDDHAGYGGVVPELAARAHVERTDEIVAQALSEAGMTPAELDAVAATSGPGLIGGVMVGMMTGKAIALSAGIPFVPVNHLEGHALSVRLTEEIDFPYLLLLVSGGHTQLLRVDGVGQYRRLGTTIDDAAGEAFDKTAKLLGLGQPGGPKVEETARNGTPERFAMPRPLHGREGCDFSFSGLKTAVRTIAQENLPLDDETKADLSAAFQAAAARHLADRTKAAMADFSGEKNRVLVLAGGVAANSAVRQRFADLTEEQGWKMLVPPSKYCTDNGAMIALAGLEKLALTGVPDQEEALAMGPKARWPLDDNPAGARHGGGKKGPKA